MAPTGIYRATNAPDSSGGGGGGGGGSSSSGVHTSRGSVDKDHDKEKQSFCTHIFARDHLNGGGSSGGTGGGLSPAVSLVGLEDPSVAVRFSPVLYEMVAHPDEKAPPTLFAGKYRYVVSVVSWHLQQPYAQRLTSTLLGLSFRMILKPAFQLSDFLLLARLTVWNGMLS